MDNEMKEFPFWGEEQINFWPKNAHRLVNPEPYFKLNKAEVRILKNKLLEWEKIRQYPVDRVVPGWRHIVHVQRVGPKFRVQDCRFPAYWDKISASLVSSETAGSTFISCCGYILDVPAQSILSADSDDVGSPIGKDGNRDILAWIKQQSSVDWVHASHKLKTPDEVIREQILQDNPYNELILHGRATSGDKLYNGIARPGEVRAKGIYLVVDPTASASTIQNEAAWAQMASRLNRNIPIFRITLNGSW